jgi:hypothetical protein
MQSKDSWLDAGAECPGIGHGELRSREYIEERLWRRRAAGTIILDAATARKPESIDVDTLLGS